jgi:hypothetical protein
MEGSVSISTPAENFSSLTHSPQPAVDSLSASDLEAELLTLTGHLNAATHRWLVLLAEFDTRNAWNGGGTQSCAHWLNWKCGIAMGAAREKVRVAHALAALPKISAAMAEGKLSYSKVRELTRVADAATEDYLLMIALHGTADHVQKTVRHFRRAKEIEELGREAKQQASRFVTYSYDEDGSLILQARLPAEAGALVLQALTAAVEHLDQEATESESEETIESENVPAETPNVKSTPRQKRADALVVMSESFLANGPKELNGGDRYQIVVHVAAETLKHDHAGCCELEDGPGLAAETARRLACDASVVKITEDEDGNPLDIGRKTRSIPPALRRAIKSRDKGCRFPGCTNTRYVDHHHIQHWAEGGETKADNLVSLCRHHHRLVHEGGFKVRQDRALGGGQNKFSFCRPDGSVIESVAPALAGQWTVLPDQHAQRGVRIDPKTAVTKWQGDRMDYGLGVEGLLGRWRKGKDQ